MDRQPFGWDYKDFASWLLDVLMYCLISVGMTGKRSAGQKKGQKDNMAGFWHLNVKGLWDMPVYSRYKLNMHINRCSLQKDF